MMPRQTVWFYKLPHCILNARRGSLLEGFVYHLRLVSSFRSMLHFWPMPASLNSNAGWNCQKILQRWHRTASELRRKCVLKRLVMFLCVLRVWSARELRLDISSRSTKMPTSSTLCKFWQILELRYYFVIFWLLSHIIECILSSVVSRLPSVQSSMNCDFFANATVSSRHASYVDRNQLHSLPSDGRWASPET